MCAWVGACVALSGPVGSAHATAPLPQAKTSRCVTGISSGKVGTFATWPGGDVRRVHVLADGATRLAWAPRKVTRTLSAPPAVEAQATLDHTVVTVALQGPAGSNPSQRAFRMPAYPAVDAHGRIVYAGSGDPCVQGVADVAAWETPIGTLVQVVYAIGDLCDGRVEDPCSLHVVPTPIGPPTTAP